jgi:hypothetical protein
MFKDAFVALYMKHLKGYTIWSKVISNDWFKHNCGADYKDWSATGL